MKTKDWTVEQAIEQTYVTRWSHQKDGKRSRKNALAFFEQDPKRLRAPVRSFKVSEALELRDKMTTYGLSPATVNRRVAAVSAVIATAFTFEQYPHPKIPGLVWMKEKGRRTRVVSDEEFEKIREGAYKLNTQVGRAIRVLWETGMRLSELLKLKWTDIKVADPNAITDATLIRIPDSKSGKPRDIPCRHELFTLCTGNRGPFSDISKTTFSRVWKRARTLSHLDEEGFVPHALRHTFATRLARAGTNIHVIAELLGHSDIQMTMRYVHAASDEKQQAILNLNKQQNQ
jgi:integrase